MYSQIAVIYGNKPDNSLVDKIIKEYNYEDFLEILYSGSSDNLPTYSGLYLFTFSEFDYNDYDKLTEKINSFDEEELYKEYKKYIKEKINNISNDLEYYDELLKYYNSEPDIHFVFYTS